MGLVPEEGCAMRRVARVVTRALHGEQQRISPAKQAHMLRTVEDGAVFMVEL